MPRDLAEALRLEEAERLALLGDLEGVVFPGPAGGISDFAARLGDLQRAGKARRRLAAAGLCAEGWTRRALGTLAAWLDALAPEDAAAAFSPGTAAKALRRPVGSPEQEIGLARFLIGAPGCAGFRLALPAAAFGDQDWLHLPHANLVVGSAGGSVLIADEEGEIRLFWTDGAEAALPRSGLEQEAAILPDRLHALPRAGGWPVLNFAPEAAWLDNPVPLLADPTEALPILAQGRGLLADVWPMASRAVERAFHALFVFDLLPGGGTSSVSRGDFQGIFAASLRDPVQVADLLSHEGAHTRIAPVYALDPMLANDAERIHPSPWRKDLRPLSGVMNGVHAFVNVCEFYRRLMILRPDFAADLAQIRDLEAGRVREAWTYLRGQARPTQVGEIFLAKLGAAAEAL
ncbi:HEXXH motif-containing putative peptide modification protein [Neomegalonema sp.]|uniref:aKG-HExxH-type peptide beta-hydroxylase n=1 Tax=Neomegalonema sp. TaxID=2039713 RepID=UPI002627F6FE|nr:HEXXH motif-containing putative peptide modification protein [Neomegalonema sp.]MDD2867456.1 HEXXH motif-containing putative peptide modification protein [Neomegalonema sp.]